MSDAERERLNEAVLQVVWPGPGLVPRTPGTVGCGLVHGSHAWDGAQIRALLKQGADPDLQVTSHDCLLDLALEKLDVDTVRLLLGLGTPAGEGDEPIPRPANATREAHPKKCSRLDQVVGRLVREGIPEGDARDASGRDLHARMVESLLSAGVEVDYADYHGHTPLMKAILAEHREITRLLLAAGASMTKTSRAGVSAMDMALSEAEPGFVDFLRHECGEDLDELAGRRQQKEIAQLRAELYRAMRHEGKRAFKTDYGYRDEDADYHLYWSSDTEQWVEESLGRKRTLPCESDVELVALLIEERYSWPKRDAMRAHLSRLLACLR